MSTKPVLLLDQDGPLADFDLAFWDACQVADIPMNITSLEDEGRKRFMSDNVLAGHHRRSRKLVEAQGWFENLPIVDGAQDGVAILEQHFDVWICTKPLEANPWCRDEKAAWIRRFFPHLEEKLILAPDKGMVRGAILLDDAIKLKWLSHAEWHPVVFPTVFNGEDSVWEGLDRWTWGDPIEKLLDFVVPII